MTFQERNTAVSLGSFTLILAYFLIRIILMLGEGGLQSSKVFRLWVFVIVAGIMVTITATIMANILHAILHAIKTQEEPTYVEDERDKLIELKGTRIGHMVTSFGTFGAMLTFALGQPPLVMFTTLIGAALVGQIAGDISRLYFYRKGV